MPVVRPPPPHGTSTVSNPSSCSASSRPITPFPAITRSSSTGWTKSPSRPGYVTRFHRLPPRVERHRNAPGRRAARSRRASPRDAWSGATTAAGTPSCRATQQTPCAMLPALVVQTPCRHSSGAAWRIALVAPRSLNEPMGWRHSSFSQISHGASTSRRTSGLGVTASAVIARARSIASSGIRTAPRHPRRALVPARRRARRRRDPRRRGRGT